MEDIVNQILFSKDYNNETNNTINTKTRTSNKNLLWKFQLYICIFMTFGVSFYYLYSLYNNSQKEDMSEKLVNNFNITHLYSNMRKLQYYFNFY